MSRTVVRLVVAACLTIVALSVPVRAQPPAPRDASAAAPRPIGDRPLNIRIDPLLEPLVEKLLRRSPTVRRQWEAIGASRLVRVSLVSSPLLRESTAARARTAISRYAFGAVRAVVELPSAVDITELLAHEFEHVLEQVEGLDLPALAKEGSPGVQQLARGVYETDRARNAGLAAMQDVYGKADPALSTAVRGMRRAFKALVPDGPVAADAAFAAGAGARRRPGASPGGHPAHKQ